MTVQGRRLGIAAMVLTLTLAGCATGTAQAPPSSSPATASRSTSRTPATVKLDPAQAERLKAAMVPLLQKMDHPLQPGEVKIGLLDDPHVNAANAGAGEFYVTTGLLQKANDEELRGVLAHEIAHADLGHVAKLGVLGAGLSVGAAILDQILPGTSAITPLAGQLIANAYTRKEEYQADAHGVEILKRAGYDGKAIMANTLTWLQETEGNSGGGFFATHPATGDRIQAVKNLE